MSDDSNPFVQTAAKPKTSSASRTLVWLLGVIIVALLCVLFVLWSVSQQHRERVEALRVAWVATTSDLAATAAKLASLQQTNADLRDRILELEKEKVLTVKMARSLEDEMRAALESKDVTISKLQGKLTVNILDRILFDSGEAVVQPDGEAVLQKIAGILKQHPELKIHVIGHTDNVPIRPGARSRFASNWELSTARALAAVRFLTERASIAPQRLGAVGYGEFRPIADNATIEGRARNRRIAITILPEELAGADTIPTPTTPPISASTTNAPAAN